ncbi:MarR family transcriptional regulator [Asanoa sp. WMMD1127]|uniref:MarR family winged helix-turn-helix transcriptional regulator n=1 Tax=Asanoa sp. WMMD1127 TaxID=3016107 RepID=UPI0024171D57|nr:MarR family transcriptional regulator [Asanoa sp. WMMD1127]MDG4824602.1 MarR family transcriptional regulator [Asanoa sp. WMMD1127]
MRNSESDARRLHELIMEFMRVGGALQPDYPIAGFQVSMTQAFAVHVLDTDPPLSQRDLVDLLGLEKSTVSRMAAELERKGLLVRERDARNRNFYVLRLTDEGRRLHAAMAEGFHQQYERWVAAMTTAEVDAALVGLSALVRVMTGERSP